jgi:hypothetical protein
MFLSTMSVRCARVLKLALVPLAAAGLVACSTTLDMDAVGTSVKEGMKSQLAMEIASVDCPKETMTAKAGATFECIATPKEGGRVVVLVTQKDDKGSVDWKTTKTEGLLDLQIVEASIKQGLKDQASIDASVSCGQRWKGAKTGGTFECQATAADGQKAAIDVTMTDGEGAISWKLREQ